MHSVVTNYKIRNLGGQFPNYTLDNRPLKEHTFIYGVSVGKDHFENDWVVGYVNFLKSIGIKKTYVLVGDTLQRHNLACVHENPMEKSVESGRIWAQKYRPLFEQLGIDCQFMYWDEIRLHAEFPKYLARIQQIAETDTKFQASLNQSINDYMQRYANREKLPCARELIESRSRDYLLEECAGFALLGEDVDLKGILYPSKAVQVMAYTFDIVSSEKRNGDKFLWLEIVPKKQKVAAVNGCTLKGHAGKIEMKIRSERMSG